MDITFEKCVVNGDEVSAVIKLTSTLSELEVNLKHTGDHRINAVRHRCVELISQRLADEYLAEHRMDLAESLSKRTIVDAIQLKIVEGFSLQGRQ